MPERGVLLDLLPSCESVSCPSRRSLLEKAADPFPYLASHSAAADLLTAKDQMKIYDAVEEEQPLARRAHLSVGPRLLGAHGQQRSLTYSPRTAVSHLPTKTQR